MPRFPDLVGLAGAADVIVAVTVAAELTYQALAPDLAIIAPWREWDMQGREDLVAFAKAHGIPVPVTAAKPYSMDRNLLHLSFEGGILEDPWADAPADMFVLTKSPEAAPDKPRYVDIDFEAGDPVAVDGEPLSPARLLARLNDMGGEHGIGRVDLVENRYVGLKSRGVYETPGGTVIRAGHMAVESLTLDQALERGFVMTMKLMLWLMALSVVLAGAAPGPKESAIALVSKVIQDVKHKEAGNDDWLPAKRGESLTPGDRAKTGEKSIAVIKFKDNSMLRVRELTEVLVNGVIEGTAFSKSAELQKGVLGFSIKKQRRGEEFRFSSPTSVASIRGTSGQFAATDSSDKLIVLEGLVQLMNKISSKQIDVEGGYTGISHRDGKLQKRPSTPEERATAQLASRVGDQTNTERHITLDRAMWGTDQAASIEPGGLVRLFRDIRVIESAMGDGVKRVYDSERPSIEKLRRPS